MNIYAEIVCTEVCHYHLQAHVTPLYLSQNRGAFIDLHELLQATCVEGQEKPPLHDDTLCLLLDTLAYVFSGMDNMPEGRGLPDQSPALMRRETVLLLLQLLKLNKMKYNLVLKKLLLCLQMLLPLPQVHSTRQIFYMQYQQYNPSKNELLEQVNITLTRIVKIFIPLLSQQQEDLPAMDTKETRDNDSKTAMLTLELLYQSILEADVPTPKYDSTFIRLPSNYADTLLESILTASYQQWKEYTQVHWLVDLLHKWYQSGNLSHQSIDKCVHILGEILKAKWSDAELGVLLQKILSFLGQLWNNTDPILGNIVCIALCDMLEQSFNQEHTDRRLLTHFIEMQALIAVCAFISSDECSAECRENWINLIVVWQSHFASGVYTPSAQEVYQLQSLERAAS